MRLDRWMLVAFVVLLALGLTALLSASAPRASFQFGDPLYYLKRQALYLLMAFPFFLLALRVSPRFLERLTYPLMAASAVLLVAVLMPGVGVKVGEARRWLHTPLGTFQPSEGAKLALVLFLARAGTRLPKETLGDFLKPLLWVGVICGLVLLEPDFSGACFIAALSLALLWAYGWKASHIAAAVLAMSPLLAVVALGESYILRRLTDYLALLRDPASAPYQLQQAFIALARGGILGVGVGLGKQKLFFLPAPHTDFVLANLGEEMGFLGITLVLGLWSLLLLRGIRVALRHRDPFGANLALGLTLMLTLQALLNMGVVLGLLPTTGLPLPFMSYGGSSLLVSLVAVGLLLNLSRGVKEKGWGRR